MDVWGLGGLGVSVEEDGTRDVVGHRRVTSHLCDYLSCISTISGTLMEYVSGFRRHSLRDAVDANLFVCFGGERPNLLLGLSPKG